MWTRKNLKDRAKEALGRNYWRIILVSVLLMLFSGGINLGYTSNHTYSADDMEDMVNDSIEYEYRYSDNEDSWRTQKRGTDTEGMMRQLEELESEIGETEDGKVAIAIGVVIVVLVFLIVFCIAFAFGYLLRAFLVNPLEVGIKRFMAKNIAEESETVKVAEVAFGFDHGYRNVVKTMFHRDLSVALWSLLFIIPGIYKSYQYRMVPYILTEHPDMPYQEVLERSKNIMENEKWNAFVLDLSFIPWELLSLMTCGMLEIFYVGAYRQLTNGALYLSLRGKGYQNER